MIYCVCLRLPLLSVQSLLEAWCVDLEGAQLTNALLLTWSAVFCNFRRVYFLGDVMWLGTGSRGNGPENLLLLVF